MTLISASTRVALKNAIATKRARIQILDDQIALARDRLAADEALRDRDRAALADLEGDLAALSPTPRVLASVPAPKEA